MEMIRQFLRWLVRELEKGNPDRWRFDGDR